MKHGHRISAFGRYGLVLGRSSPETMGFCHGFPMKDGFFCCKVSHPSNENSQVFSGMESMKHGATKNEEFHGDRLGISSGIHGEYLISLGFETGFSQHE